MERHDCESCFVNGQCGIQPFIHWLKEHESKVDSMIEQSIDNLSLIGNAYCKLFPSVDLDNLATVLRQACMVGYYLGRKEKDY